MEIISPGGDMGEGRLVWEEPLMLGEGLGGFQNMGSPPC